MPVKKVKPRPVAPAKKLISLRVAQAVAVERERCAKCVPTTWLDSLLSGDKKIDPLLTTRGIEALLRAVQDRIRNSP